MKRAIILKYIFVKGLAAPPIHDLGEIMREWRPEERSQLVTEATAAFTRNVDQLKASGLWRDVEESERAFLEAAIDQIATHQRVDASWLAESIMCLLWALEIVSELQSYDREASHELVKMLPAIPTKELVKQSRLRTREEIKKQRDIAELWHWRARTRRLQEEGQLRGKLFGGRTIEEIIELSASKGAESGDLPPAIDSDFPVLGKAYRDLSPEEFATLTSIAQERHKAFNWLCGWSPTGRWMDTPTDT